MLHNHFILHLEQMGIGRIRIRIRLYVVPGFYVYILYRIDSYRVKNVHNILVTCGLASRVAKFSVSH